jgi:hypothetical protein
MSRNSSIMDYRSGVWTGRCEPAVGIRKLECLQMQVVERFAVVATCRTQEPTPERAQVLPSRAQVLMVVIREVPQLAQPEFRNYVGDLVRHGEESRGKSGVLPSRIPCDNERIPREVDGRLAQKQAFRARRPAVPRRVILRPLPPGRVPELDIRKQKWALTCSPACRATQTPPEIPMHPHHLGHGAFAVLACDLHHLLYEQFVELVNELEARAAGPRRDGH